MAAERLQNTVCISFEPISKAHFCFTPRYEGSKFVLHSEDAGAPIDSDNNKNLCAPSAGASSSSDQGIRLLRPAVSLTVQKSRSMVWGICGKGFLIRCCLNSTTKKSRKSFRFAEFWCGVDEARTRDLLRDRQAL